MTQILGAGGIGLEHATVTDDGRTCAIEFNAVRFGRQARTPQAGLAAYERGPTGRLHAARIYDDVNVEELQQGAAAAEMGEGAIRGALAKHSLQFAGEPRATRVGLR